MCRWAADYDDGAQSGVRVVRISSGFKADKITLCALCWCRKKGLSSHMGSSESQERTVLMDRRRETGCVRKDGWNKADEIDIHSLTQPAGSPVVDRFELELT
jgi:hypothetical protein